MKYVIDLDKESIVGPLPKLENVKGASVPLTELLSGLSDKLPFSTDLMPVSADGVLSIRTGFGFEQIVYQRKPGVYTVKWGARERDPNAKLYNLAHPWRIIIMDYKNGSLLGVRHFYSPYNITHWDQPLYAVNLPNTNTTGYRGTSVGWVCNYHNDDTTKMTLAEHIAYGIARESGWHEPYNDANMSETDGTRFYQNRKSPSFMWNRVEWQKKTETEGYEWICEEDLLVPLRILHSDTYAMSHTNNTDDSKSYEYTLRRAVFSPYSAYYTDADKEKPFNILAEHGWENPDYVTLLSSPVRLALGAGALVKKTTAPEPIVVENLAQALKTMKNLTLAPLPVDLHRKISSGYTCENCNDYVTTQDGNPLYVYRTDSKLMESKFYKDSQLIIPEDYVAAFLDRYDAETAIIVKRCEKWCPRCIQISARTCEYWISQEVVTDSSSKIAQQYHIPIRIDDYEYSLKGADLILGLHTVKCPKCQMKYHENHTLENMVFDQEKRNIIGCLDCMSEVGLRTATDGSSFFTTIQNQNKDWKIKVSSGPNTLAAQSVTTLSEQTHPQCACNIPLDNDVQHYVSNDGIENVCNSCIGPNGDYCSIFSAVSTTPINQPEDNNG